MQGSSYEPRRPGPRDAASRRLPQEPPSASEPDPPPGAPSTESSDPPQPSRSTGNSRSPAGSVSSRSRQPLRGVPRSPASQTPSASPRGVQETHQPSQPTSEDLRALVGELLDQRLQSQLAVFGEQLLSAMTEPPASSQTSNTPLAASDPASAATPNPLRAAVSGAGAP